MQIVGSIVVVLSVLLALAPPARAQTAADPNLVVEMVVGDLQNPSSMAFYGQGDFLVLEKDTGRVINVVDGVKQPGAALDLAVHSGPERGLIGIAVHPDFPTVPRVYLYYTPSATGGDTSNGNPLPSRIERYTFSNGTLSSPQLVLTLAYPVDTVAHYGGPMIFGPDKKLYVIVGDRLQSGGLQNEGPVTQANDTGVILRLNDDGTAAPGNPLSVPGINVSRYYAYGIRNSYGIAFDPATGVLWETENGPDSYDELNRVAPGFNSGWSALMGPDSRDPNGTADLTAISGGVYSDPEFSWQNTHVPTGIAFLRGSALGAAYNDSLVVGSYSGTIVRFRLNAAGTAIVPPHSSLNDLVLDPGDDESGLAFASGFLGVTDLEVGPDGNLYAVAILNGVVFRIRSNQPQTDSDGDGVFDAMDNCPTIANPNQEDGAGGNESPPDGVGNHCDNCLHVNNPRVAPGYLTVNPWRTLTGGQVDDDHDGYGNKCDGKFVGLPNQTVGGLDLAQFRASNSENRRFDTCGTSNTRPCAIFDLDEATAGDIIGGLDLGRFRQLNARTPGPRCAACTGTGSAVLPCTAGTAGNCN